MELPFFTTTASSSSTTTSKGEALRWLAIAEKLLAGRDLVGSKSFASRAREADPTLLYAEQIIAVADTLVAGDEKINNQPDWYSILHLAGNQTHDMERIAGQYRRLTFLLSPQKNGLPYADQAFNLVMNAWSVLSNSSSKTAYDNELMAHLSVISPSSGFNNPIFSGVTREQVNYQPFEINFQVMTQQQQQGVGREQVSQMLPMHGMNRERVSQQFIPQNATQEQATLSFHQLHLSREQAQQPPPQFQHQQLPQVQPQPQLRPEPQPQHLRTENWMDSNVTETFSAKSGSHNQNINSSNLGGNASDVSQSAKKNEVMKEDRRKGSSDDHSLNFWTSCPYCYYMYEYPKVYAECILKCQNKKCRKAFHGVTIPSPPLTVEGKDGYFCSWGVMPMGISMAILDRRRGIGGNWTPFSPMFTCPKGAGNIGNTSNVNLFGGENANKDEQGSRGGNSDRNTSGPRVVVDDDDVFVEYSDSGGESDSDWARDGGMTGKGRKRNVTATPSRNVHKAHIDKVQTVNAQVSDVTDEFVLKEGAGFSAASVTEPSKKRTADSRMKGISESSKKGASSNSRRQSARVAKNFGSLDLNIEFSNEAEEPRRRVSQYNGSGRGEEDIIIEGGGFFEGLDEFLSSLPISLSEG